MPLNPVKSSKYDQHPIEVCEQKFDQTCEASLACPDSAEAAKYNGQAEKDTFDESKKRNQSLCEKILILYNEIPISNRKVGLSDDDDDDDSVGFNVNKPQLTHERLGSIDFTIGPRQKLLFGK